MIPLPTITNVLRAAVRGLTATGQPWVNVIHFRYTGTPSAGWVTEINALDPILFKFYGGPIYTGGYFILQQMGSNSSIQDITYTPLDGTTVSTVKPHIQAGSVAPGVGAPSEVAAVLTLRTDHRGRRYRGRIYLITNVASNYGADGNLIATYVNNVITQWNGMASAMVSANWKPVVASYGNYRGVPDKHGVVTTWTPFATDVTSVTMDVRPDVQRRRK